MNIDNINAIHNNLVRISDHADEEAEADELSFDEIYFSVLDGERSLKIIRMKSRIQAV